MASRTGALQAERSRRRTQSADTRSVVFARVREQQSRNVRGRNCAKSTKHSMGKTRSYGDSSSM